jgi:hypothetical protein
VVGLPETHGRADRARWSEGARALPDSVLAETDQIVDVDMSSGSNEGVLRFGGAQ